MKAVRHFELPLKLKKAEIDLKSEMDKGDYKNRDILQILAKQKKEMKAELDSLPIGSVKSREDLLLKCEILLANLEEAYITALADDSGTDESIDMLIKDVKVIKANLL